MASTQMKKWLCLAPLVLMATIQVASCIVTNCLRENVKADSSYNSFGSYGISLSQTSHCYEWNISTEHGAGKVSLYLSSLRANYQFPCTTSSRNSVAIYYGNSTNETPNAILCGSKSDEYFLSNFSSMTVVASPYFSGYFNFQYKSVGDNECKVQHLIAQTTDEYIKSSYLSMQSDDCYEWRITSASPSRQISLYLSSFSRWSNLPCNKSSSSYMAIFDGSNSTFPQKALLCGQQYGNTYWSSGASMTVFYRSSVPNYDSFTITYRTAQSYITSTDNSAACKVEYLTADSFYKYLSSPDASSSPKGRVCYEWHIATTVSMQVSLRVSRLYVDANSPCTTSSNSYVAIYDGSSTISSELAVLCGYHYTGTYLSSSSMLTVVYRSSDLSRDDFSFSYSSTEVSTKRNYYYSQTDAYTSQAPNKTIWIISTIGSMIGLLSCTVGLVFVHNKRKNQRLARAATTASVSSNIAFNSDPSNSSLPTFSSPATFNTWQPSYWQLGDQNVAPTTSSGSKLQLEETSSSTASPLTTNYSGDTISTPAPPPYHAHATNLYTDLGTVRSAGGAATGTLETPTYAAYTNTAVIGDIKAQE